MQDCTPYKTQNAPPEPPCSAIESYMAGLKQTLKDLPYPQIGRAVDVLLGVYKENGAVYLFGNGGSAALASHFACDLAKGTVVNGAPRFRALSLTDNVPLMTAWANDLCYEDIFAEQLRGLIRPKDVAFAISGSGNSPNVLSGLEVARDLGAFSVVLTGFQGGKAAGLADLSIIIPSSDMQHIEDLHLSITHSIFRAVRSQIVEKSRAYAVKACAVGAD
jgi:D-sedoheptulose 7-phosphate isomerase